VGLVSNLLSFRVIFSICRFYRFCGFCVGVYFSICGLLWVLFPFCGFLWDWFGFITLVAFMGFFFFCGLLSFGRPLRFVEVCGFFYL
jgi:hypothetical protein